MPPTTSNTDTNEAGTIASAMGTRRPARPMIQAREYLTPSLHQSEREEGAHQAEGGQEESRRPDPFLLTATQNSSLIPSGNPNAQA
jgi:hypothetical protein